MIAILIGLLFGPVIKPDAGVKVLDAGAVLFTIADGGAPIPGACYTTGNGCAQVTCCPPAAICQPTGLCPIVPTLITIQANARCVLPDGGGC